MNKAKNLIKGNLLWVFILTVIICGSLGFVGGKYVFPQVKPEEYEQALTVIDILEKNMCSLYSNYRNYHLTIEKISEGYSGYIGSAIQKERQKAFDSWDSLVNQLNCN